MRSLIFLCLSCFGLTAFGQLPEDFYDQKVSDAYQEVMGITFDEDGRMFIWEKEGKIYMHDTLGNPFPQPIIDIHERISNWKDHGLMSVALDPNFQTNGFIYLFYAVDLHHYKYFGTADYHPDSTTINYPTFGRVSRFQLDPSTDFQQLASQDEHILLGQTPSDGIPLLYEYHGIGTIVFGEDGTLLLSCGDTSSNMPDIGGDVHGTFAALGVEEGIITPDQDLGSFKAQYLGNVNGKVLRIDAFTGDGLASNPFYDETAPRAPQSRIWAYGLRNPYRIAVWPNTGSHYPADGQPGYLFIGDVGNGAWEELNLARRGGENFGWPLGEGLKLPFSFWSLDPIPNPMTPNPLYGQNGCEQEFFHFRDIVHRPVKSLNGNLPGNPCDSSQPLPEFVHASWESLPILAWSNARWNAPTRAVVPDTLDQKIEERMITEEGSGIEGENFDGYSSLAGAIYTASSYPQKYWGKYFAIDFSGWIKVFEFDDNYELKKVEAFHNDSKDIIHMALNPKDGQLYYVNLQSEIRTISYGGSPPPVAVINVDQVYGVSPLNVQFDASGSFSPGNIALTNFLWNFGDGQTSTEVMPQHVFTASNNAPTSYEVQLVVTDSLGNSTSAQRVISLNNTPPEVRISSFEDGDLYPMHATTVLSLQAEVSDLEHSAEELTYQWRVYFHHNDHYHPEPVDFNPNSFALISPLGCEDELYWYRIELKVSDPEGLSAFDSRSIYPNCEGAEIEAIDLQGQTEENINRLVWEYESAEHNAQFEVQRSQDFYTFLTIGTVNNDQQFFEDSAPLLGTNIYRIKAITPDRTYTYSNMISLDFPPKKPIRIFPNPAKHSFFLELDEAEASLIHLSLYNTAGNQLFESSWPAEAGQPFSKKILTNLIDNGFYIYRIRNGNSEQSGKLLVSK